MRAYNAFDVGLATSVRRNSRVTPIAQLLAHHRAPRARSRSRACGGRQRVHEADPRVAGRLHSRTTRRRPAPRRSRRASRAGRRAARPTRGPGPAVGKPRVGGEAQRVRLKPADVAFVGDAHRAWPDHHVRARGQHVVPQVHALGVLHPGATLPGCGKRGAGGRLADDVANEDAAIGEIGRKRRRRRRIAVLDHERAFALQREAMRLAVVPRRRIKRNVALAPLAPARHPGRDERPDRWVAGEERLGGGEKPVGLAVAHDARHAADTRCSERARNARSASSTASGCSLIMACPRRAEAPA